MVSKQELRGLPKRYRPAANYGFSGSKKTACEAFVHDNASPSWRIKV